MAASIPDCDKVSIVMLHLEGRALDWHRYYAQKHGNLDQLIWQDYAQALKERFGSRMFKDSMAEMVTLRQKGTVEEYHDQFVSLLTQVHFLNLMLLAILLVT